MPLDAFGAEFRKDRTEDRTFLSEPSEKVIKELLQYYYYALYYYYYYYYYYPSNHMIQ